jgi:hypothetical protein
MERIISAAFSFLIGTVGLWTGFKQLRNRAALNIWPTTKGRVIERGVYEPYMPAAGPPAFRHSPLVKYVYQGNAIHCRRRLVSGDSAGTVISAGFFAEVNQAP